MLNAEILPSPADLSRSQIWLRALAIGAGYWLLGEPCHELSISSVQAPLLWLPAGFLIGVLILHPLKAWIPFAVAAVSASVVIEANGPGWSGVAVVAAVLTPIASVLTAWLLRHVARERLRTALSDLGPWLTLGAGAFAGVLVGLIEWAKLGLLGSTHPIESAESWLGATLIGVLIACPLVLAAGDLERRKRPVGPGYWLELLAVSAATAALMGLVFLREQRLASAFWPAPYLIFPMLIWAALRLGTLGTSSCLLVIGVLAAAATPGDLGPVAKLADTDESRLLLFQGFLLVAAISAHLLSSATKAAAEAESSVLQTEERYRSIFEGASDAIFLMSREGACIDVNRAGEELTGYSRGQLIGRLSKDLIDPSDLERQPWRDADVLKGLSFVHERTIIRADGRKLMVEVGVKPLPDGRVTAICRELGQRRKLEVALKAIVGGTSVHTGEAFFEHLVRGLAEALGVRYAIVAEITDFPPETVRTLAIWADGAAMPAKTYNLKGTPCAMSIENQVCFCSEGVQAAFPQDKMLGEMGAESYLGVVITDRFEKRIGLLAVLDDRRLDSIEPAESILRIFAIRAGAELERLRSELALRQSETRQRALLDAFPDSFFVMTMDGVYIDFHSPEPERLRLPPNEFIGKSFRDVMPKELQPLYEKAFSALKAGKRAKVFEYESDLGGVRRIFEVRHNHVGEGLVLAILRDVTRRREYDEEIQKLNENLERLVEQRTEQLAAANRELETFAYSVSHDLRAPLRGIHANASILKEDLGPNIAAPNEETLERILSRATEMSNLIDGLLKISRIMRADLQREVIDLSALAKEAFEGIQRWHTGRKLNFLVQPGLRAKGDRVLLSAALGNLIDNAVKFTVHQAEARIEFGATVEDFETVFWISDNGVGFDMEHAGKLFRPFERLHSVDDFAGTGIGLATVQRVVQRHGGRIWAEGKVGQGSTFYFTLGPLSDVDNPSSPENQRDSD